MPLTARSITGRLAARVRRAIQQPGAADAWPSSLALRLFERAGRVPVYGPRCHHWAGFLHAAARRPDRAIAHYEAARDAGLARHAALRYDLGLAWLDAEEPERAEPELLAALALTGDGDHWPAYGVYKLGQAWLDAGQPARAEAHFRTAAARASGAVWPVYGLFDALQAQGRESEIVPMLLTAAAGLAPEHVRDLPFPDHLAPQVERDDAQVHALRTLLRRHPDASRAALLLARVETLRGEIPAAVELFRCAGRQRWGGPDDAAAATPAFLIIGQMKAGTSALFQYLSAHPMIEPAMVKEPEYWSLNHALGPDWYGALFPPRRAAAGRITGEASTNYFTHADAPGRVARELPDVKLILLLREPVARAYSEYWMRVRLGEQARSFEDVVAAELDQTPMCPLDYAALDDGRIPDGYLTRSAALPHLKRWLAHVRPAQLLIVRNEDLSRDLAATMQRICRFLGVPPFVPADRRRYNEGSYPALSPELHERLRQWFAPHQQALETFLAALPETQP